MIVCIFYLSWGGQIVDLLLTDIPYEGVNHPTNGIRTFDKGKANVLTFNLHDYLELVWEKVKSTFIIFCGEEQLSEIYQYFLDRQNEGKGTVRHIVWHKSNPSPVNGQFVYLSGVENAIWFKKRGGTFNAHCKNTVFKYPCGRSKLHPTEKNHELLRELIKDNSNVGDLVLDTCCGSGSHCLVAKEENRHYIGIEIDSQYYEIAKNRLM